jgi:hypothetical protein
LLMFGVVGIGLYQLNRQTRLADFDKAVTVSQPHRKSTGCGKLSHFSAERKATRAVLTAFRFNLSCDEDLRYTS